MNPIEWIAAGLGIVTVALVVTRSIWNYPFAVAMVSLYFFVFFEARLYSDALLQIFFLVINLYGWWNWLRSRHETGEVVVTALTSRQRLLWLSGTLAASMLWGLAMARYTDAAAPVWDALIAGGSVAAQILQARRRLESWVLWIAVDIVAVPLYFSRGLIATSALYVVFLVLAAAGLFAWWKAWRARQDSNPTPADAGPQAAQ
ncbi:MAG: nicotinamide mononucleotide transporter [Sphingomonadales bacterium]|jgi:nicotinamide mononucleotide transporter|nr:nicotinamide mononucleotide transporter [Sphingomonadales bacterium]